MTPAPSAIETLSVAAVRTDAIHFAWNPSRVTDAYSIDDADATPGTWATIDPAGVVYDADDYDPADVEPVISAVWPFGNDDAPRGVDLAEGQALLSDLPVCLVHWVDLAETPRVGLALTGGGMDLSDRIAEAYVRLGYLPPAALAPLPDFAGHEHAPALVAAVERSLFIAGL